MANRTFRYDKLVRDRTEERVYKLHDANAKVVLKNLSHEELIQEFKIKLQEETLEVIEATTHDEILNELADVLEVIRGFAKAQGISLDELEAARVAKAEERGAFDHHVYIETITVDENAPVVKYCLKYSEKYPEVVNKN